MSTLRRFAQQQAQAAPPAQQAGPSAQVGQMTPQMRAMVQQYLGSGFTSTAPRPQPAEATAPVVTENTAAPMVVMDLRGKLQQLGQAMSLGYAILASQKQALTNFVAQAQAASEEFRGHAREFVKLDEQIASEEAPLQSKILALQQEIQKLKPTASARAYEKFAQQGGDDKEPRGLIQQYTQRMKADTEVKKMQLEQLKREDAAYKTANPTPTLEGKEQELSQAQQQLQAVQQKAIQSRQAYQEQSRALDQERIRARSAAAEGYAQYQASIASFSQLMQQHAAILGQLEQYAEDSE
jgi:hypothetical protein